jgi:hypothetical protein
VLDVERFHHTALDLLNHGRTIAGDVAVVGKGVQSRYETVSKSLSWGGGRKLTARATEIIRSGSPVGVSLIRDLLGTREGRHGVEADDTANLTVADFRS